MIAFVDFSASTKADRQVYTQALERVKDALRPGDRILVGRIGSTTLTSFEPITDISLETIAAKHWWENPIDYTTYHNDLEKHDRVLLSTEWAKIDDALSRPAVAQRSCIRASLKVAAQAFAGEPTPHDQKVLLILSDMLEDCDNVDFEKQAPDASEIARILKQTKEAGELPNLGGVRVYVVGATAESTERFQDVENFWLSYLRGCGTAADDANYTHYLINFALHYDNSSVAAPSSAPKLVSNPDARKSICAKAWGLGSTESDVLAAAGTPLDSRSGQAGVEEWIYPRGSYVRFSEQGKVIEFFNSGRVESCK